LSRSGDSASTWSPPPIAAPITAPIAFACASASPDFFDAAKYPEATFKSTKVEKGAAEGQLKVTGDLTLHGVTKPVVLDVTVNKVGEHPMRKAQAAGFDATATIKRSEFGIAKYVPAVSDDIKLRITSDAIDAKAYAEILKPKG
jgi:polyisoprenoid-binding protein YceI